MANSEIASAAKMWVWWVKEMSVGEDCLGPAICNWSYSGMCGCDRGTEQGRQNRNKPTNKPSAGISDISGCRSNFPPSLPASISALLSAERSLMMSPVTRGG